MIFRIISIFIFVAQESGQLASELRRVLRAGEAPARRLWSSSISRQGGVAMSGSTRQSRRDVLKLTAAGAVAPLLGPVAARAAPKSLTMMHESSFVPPYDAFFKNKLAPAYEKATGIKVNYEVVSVGSLLTRVTTAA